MQSPHLNAFNEKPRFIGVELGSSYVRGPASVLLLFGFQVSVGAQFSTTIATFAFFGFRIPSHAETDAETALNPTRPTI